MRKSFSKYLLRIFVCLMAFAIPLSSLQICVAADEADGGRVLPQVTVENKTVHRGQMFTLQVSLDQNPGLVAMVLELKYDKTAMELVGVERGNALQTHTFTTTNTETNAGYLVEPFRLLWDGTTQDYTTGVLLTLTFESKISAPLGDYPVEFAYDAKNTNSEYGKPIAVDIDNGIVTLIKGELSVIFQNYDGTVLYEKDYNPGDMETIRDIDELYVGEIPTRPTDECYSYAFKDWKGALSDDPNVVIRIADYATTPQLYQVTFFVDGEYFHGAFCGYGEFVDLSYIPSEKNHVFSGWYADEDYTQRISSQKMPASDIVLYGYMKYNVRETNIPQITLTVARIEGSMAYVDVNVTANSGLAGLILTLEYDRTALELVGFERGDAFGALQFTHTNNEDGFGAEPFKFYWENAVNTYDLGTIVTLQFHMNGNAAADVYDVTVTYDETSDATYFTPEGELWYTLLDIYGTVVPVNKIYHWNEKTAEGVEIDVTTEEGQSPDTVLEVKLVTYEFAALQETVQSIVGKDMELKAVYSIRLLCNGVEVHPKGKITVKIALTHSQAACSVVRALRINDVEDVLLYPSSVVDGYLIFETDTLGHWGIVGDIYIGGSGQAPINTISVMIGLCVLAIVTMAFVLILIARVKNRKQVFIYTEDE